MEIDLDYVIPIDATQNLWITFYNQGVSYPAASCANTGDANGRWYSTNGTYWYNVSYTWMIRGYVEEVDTSISWSNRIGKPIVLNEGWNWFSSFVEIDNPTAALQMLEEALGENGLTIQSVDEYTTYEDGEWGAMGDLEEIENRQLYMIKVSTDCEVELQGVSAIPSDYTITISQGWNWIGFPSAEVISIEDAFADFEAEDGDMILSADEYTTFEDGDWGVMGDLEEMTPGQGYMYYSASDEVKYLVIQAGASKTNYKK